VLKHSVHTAAVLFSRTGREKELENVRMKQKFWNFAVVNPQIFKTVWFRGKYL
jgi:hypothetical protein